LDPVNRETFLMVRADRDQLIEIARLLDTGEIRPGVAAVFPLGQAQQAYAWAAQGHLRGKVVLQVANEQ
jgi:NADPH:quinone reductase-like Zn-dependent oxidoreductase